MKTIIIALFLLVGTVMLVSDAFAHSGRTNRWGGHHNWKSGYGSYHYHGMR